MPALDPRRTRLVNGFADKISSNAGSTIHP
jgi:hypothetical protein